VSLQVLRSALKLLVGVKVVGGLVYVWGVKMIAKNGIVIVVVSFGRKDALCGG